MTVPKPDVRGILLGLLKAEVDTKLLDRFASKIAPDTVTDCWLWQDSLDRDGYGRFRVGPTKIRAHRFAYMLCVEPLDPCLVIDHVAARGCVYRCCVNPGHLEQVTVRTNTLRSDIAITAVNATKTHCPQGHEYTVENTYIHKRRRACITCVRQTGAAWDAAHRIERRDAARARREARRKEDSPRTTA